jgi:hypothetical protein
VLECPANEGEFRDLLSEPLQLCVQAGYTGCSAVAVAVKEVLLVAEGDAPRVSEAVGEGVGVPLALLGVGVDVGERVGVELPERVVLLVEEGDAPRVSEAVGEAESVLLALGALEENGTAAAALGEAAAAGGEGPPSARGEALTLELALQVLLALAATKGDLLELPVGAGLAVVVRVANGGISRGAREAEGSEAEGKGMDAGK